MNIFLERETQYQDIRKETVEAPDAQKVQINFQEGRVAKKWTMLLDRDRKKL